jgi:hypothetical protein
MQEEVDMMNTGKREKNGTTIPEIQQHSNPKEGDAVTPKSEKSRNEAAEWGVRILGPGIVGRLKTLAQEAEAIRDAAERKVGVFEDLLRELRLEWPVWSATGQGYVGSMRLIGVMPDEVDEAGNLHRRGHLLVTARSFAGLWRLFLRPAVLTCRRGNDWWEPPVFDGLQVHLYAVPLPLLLEALESLEAFMIELEMPIHSHWAREEMKGASRGVAAEKFSAVTLSKSEPQTEWQPGEMRPVADPR